MISVVVLTEMRKSLIFKLQLQILF